MRSKKKPAKAPLVRCSGTMTEAQYLSWIRSALRSKSLRWPPRAEALKLARRAYKGPNRLQKWEYQCSICKEWHLGKNVIVDHFPVSAGSILHTDDIGPFANNLYCEVENLRVLDKVCHDIHSLSESLGLSWEEAKVQKRVIAAEKGMSVKEIIAMLNKMGYNDVSNKEKRRKALTEMYSKGETNA